MPTPITITPASTKHAEPVTLSAPSGYLAKATATTCAGKPVAVRVAGLTATPLGARHAFVTWTVADPSQASSVRTVMALTSNQGCPAGTPHRVSVSQLPAGHVGNGTHSTTVAEPPPHSSALPVADIAGAALAVALLAAVVIRRRGRKARRPERGQHRA
jgi:hypothetical protein